MAASNAHPILSYVRKTANQNPNAEDVTGVDPGDAEKWFQVFNDLV